MNLLLLEPGDFVDGTSTIRLTDRRLQHVREVLRSQVGESLRVGLLEGPLGEGRITALGSGALEMSVTLGHPPPPPAPITLLLALPRPKVLRRLLAAITSMGVKTLFLIHSYRVEKSYWQTPFLTESAIRKQLLLGLEQGGDTLLPTVHLRRRFKPFVEDELPGLAEGTQALVAHPGTGSPAPSRGDRTVTLAIGPEGGFIPYEIERLQKAGFASFQLGPRALRVETAVAAILGRLL
ncbi:MAG: 16S rRNA (uracil(1498)-N(3))-methyltransferase [Deltaproteobacteria bacterium]|nr:16S rRNA (uracil(1498)-N(3))-methyltransferase [Deltaproteobacteria bacterium]